MGRGALLLGDVRSVRDVKDMEDVGNVDVGREGREGRGLGTWCIIYLQIRGNTFCKILWEQWLCVVPVQTVFA